MLSQSLDIIVNIILNSFSLTGHADADSMPVEYTDHAHTPYETPRILLNPNITMKKGNGKLNQSLLGKETSCLQVKWCVMF